MNLMEALDLVTFAVEQLRDEGITATITPSRSRNDPRVVASHRGPDYLPVERWVWVAFLVDSLQEAQQVAQARKHLGWRGISFDVGGIGTTRDWFLDWSFRVEDVPDGEWEHRADVAERILQTGLDEEPRTG